MLAMEVSVNNKPSNPVFINVLFSIFIGCVSVVWFVRGEVVLPNKGVFIDGSHAKLLALIVIIHTLKNH